MRILVMRLDAKGNAEIKKLKIKMKLIMKIILWNMMTNILITPMLKNREQHFMVLFFYGIDMQRINVYRVVINFQVTK